VSSSGAVSLADIFLTFFPVVAASASSLAFFFIFSFLMPLSMASRVFSAFSLSVSVEGVEGVSVEGVEGAVHTSFSFSPPPVPGTTEPAALVAPTVQFAQVQVFPLLDANVLAAHVHDVEVPPVLLEYAGQAWHALPSKYCVVVQLSAVSQPEPLYPDLHVHSHDPAVPLTVPPLMQ